MKYSDEQKEDARKRYFAGERVAEISAATGVELRTLYTWIDGGNWKCVANRQNTLSVMERRIWDLVVRENKSLMELFELEQLTRHFERLKKLEAQLKTKRESYVEVDETGAPKKKRGRKPAKNDFTSIDEETLIEKLFDGLFEYQKILWEERRQRNRNILKSRQIGLTYYFAREAFADALLTGRNKIFLSASRAQADVFREYIKVFALEWFDIEISGVAKVELHTPHGTATLHFLSTNSSTAQSHTGDVYVDEYFWIPKFSTLKKVASAMGSQEKWCKTYFSTPSAKSHEAYPFWSGDEYNERCKRANRAIEIFPDRDILRKSGVLCPDGQWRWIITLDDAERMGCNLFKRSQLEQEYSEDEFRNLFLCFFVDDSASVFSYAQLEKCLGDRKKYPSGVTDRPVWIGYDPSRTRDGACIVVVSPPATYKGKFYVLEKITRYGLAWPAQAGIIKDLTRKYKVGYIGIDSTGPGSGVLEIVQSFYPAAEGIFYTLERKTKLVLKAQSVIIDKRIVWDSSWSDIAAGFLSIKRGGSQSGQLTYFADRNDKTGHADAAWAVMHALAREDLFLPDHKEKNTYVV